MQWGARDHKSQPAILRSGDLGFDSTVVRAEQNKVAGIDGGDILS